MNQDTKMQNDMMNKKTGYIDQPLNNTSNGL